MKEKHAPASRRTLGPATTVLLLLGTLILLLAFLDTFHRTRRKDSDKCCSLAERGGRRKCLMLVVLGTECSTIARTVMGLSLAHGLDFTLRPKSLWGNTVDGPPDGKYDVIIKYNSLDLKKDKQDLRGDHVTILVVSQGLGNPAKVKKNNLAQLEDIAVLLGVKSESEERRKVDKAYRRLEEEVDLVLCEDYLEASLVLFSEAAGLDLTRGAYAPTCGPAPGDPPHSPLLAVFTSSLLAHGRSRLAAEVASLVDANRKFLRRCTYVGSGNKNLTLRANADEECKFMFKTKGEYIDELKATQHHRFKVLGRLKKLMDTLTGG